MAVLPPRRLFMWITITACVVGLLVGLFLCAFPIVLLLVLVRLSCSPAAVLRCFEMREPMTFEVCLVDECLLAVLAAA